MVVGIGGFRDIGDPNDPRRRMGARPQEANIIGLPQGGAYSGLAMDRAIREDAIDKEMARQKLAQTVANLRPEGPLASLDRAVSALTGRQVTNTPEGFYSAQTGEPVSRQLANRALQYSQALPELNPEQALTLAKLDLAGQDVPPAILEKMANISELKPDLAVQNAMLAAETGTTDAVQAAAATMAAESPRERAEAVVDMDRGEPFRETSRAENVAISEEMGRNRQIPGTGRRNPFKKEQSERTAEDSYQVPVLVGPEDPNNPGQAAVNWEGGEINRRTGKKRPQYDPRQARIAMLDPQMQVPTTAAEALNLIRMVQPDDERSGVGMNVPTPERNYYAGVGKDEPGSVTPGFGAGNDPADTRVAGDMTLAQAVKQIEYENRTPIRTYRYGADVNETSDGRLVNSQGVEVFELPNQPEGFRERGLVEVRVGSPTMITNKGMAKISQLLQGLPGMEGGVVLANQRLNDPTINQAQNALLQMSMSDDVVGDVGANPERKPAHALIKALTAGAGLPPSDRDIAAVELAARSKDNPYTQVANPILASSSVNPAVRKLRAMRQSVEGRPDMRDYGAYAEALGAPVGSEIQEKAMREAAMRQVALNDSQLNAPVNPASDADKFARKRVQEILAIRRNQAR
ncbi:MAG TPA: hypothetical protein DEP13_08150 [Gammaproteobacteria bacterium]|nr:hypothetical protein [Gammaproteobacteria bacterium]